MTEFQGKVALITGASRDIGRAIALAYAAAGASVAVTARTAAQLDSLVAEIEGSGGTALPIPADLAVEADIRSIVERTVERFRRVDILVNNAAIIHPRMDLVDFDPALWRQVLDVNLTAVALLTKAILPGLITQRSGKIINISSIGGRKGARGRSAYRVTKAALISLTESVAAEVKRHGIDVNCICPGGVDTEGYREAFQSQGRADNPRLMESAEIASLALFLVSDASSAITGTAIDAFGGTNPLFS
ncbi:MAG: SDR family NAD(P)-dependent oxidoreductase [Caldilineaceae bacterium]